MELYLIRHGNMTGDPHLHAEPPVEGCLSETGERQAAALAAALADVRFDLVYASPLGRAVQTAQALADPRGLTVGTLPWLVEWRPAPELMGADNAKFEEMMKAAGEIPPEQTWKTFAGEGVCDMAGRIIPGFLKLMAAHGAAARHGGYVLDDPDDDTRIALVGHGGSLGVLLAFFLGIPINPRSVIGFTETGTAVVHFRRRIDVWYPVLRIDPPAPQAGRSPAIQEETV